MSYKWSPFFWGLIAWAGLVLGGIFLNHYFNQTSQAHSIGWIAAKELPINHQLVENDLKRPENLIHFNYAHPIEEYIGSYVLVNKLEGEVISIEDISRKPYIQTDMGQYYFLYPLTDSDTYLVEVLEANSQIKLCIHTSLTPVSDEAPIDSPKITCTDEVLKVLAVHESQDTLKTNWLALEVSEEQIDHLGNFLAAENSFILVKN